MRLKRGKNTSSSIQLLVKVSNGLIKAPALVLLENMHHGGTICVEAFPKMYFSSQENKCSSDRFVEQINGLCCLEEWRPNGVKSMHNGSGNIFACNWNGFSPLTKWPLCALKRGWCWKQSTWASAIFHLRVNIQLPTQTHISGRQQHWSTSPASYWED